MEPGDFQETTPDDPNHLLGVPQGCLWGPGLPRGAGSLKETTQATQKRPPAAEASRFQKNTQKRRALACVEMCTPSRQDAHIGQKRVPGERESRRLAEKYKQMRKHTLLKMCTPSRPEAHFEVIGAPGERQSRRYAELFVVALKGACGSHLASQKRSHEARDLLRDGQRSANHDVRLSFHTNHQNHVF